MASPPEPTGGLAVPDAPLSVRFAHLHFAYEHGTFALADVDLTIPAGTTCALVGRTGSGKSTLASLLSRAVEPERGSVFLGGVDPRVLLRTGRIAEHTPGAAGRLARMLAPPSVPWNGTRF
jgi:ABC-type multidrug transport system fused ATPase/permease subunit